MEVHSILQIEMRKLAAGFQGVSELKSGSRSADGPANRYFSKGNSTPYR